MRRSSMAAASTARTDMPCDCTDTAVFAGLARQLPRDAVWVTSHLRRTHETARAIVRAGLPGPAEIPGPDAPAMPDLAEQNFGDWQGLTYDELRHSRGGAFHRFWHAPAHERAPGGESFVDVMQRVARAIHAWSTPIAAAISSRWRMAARSAPRSAWRSASTRKPVSPSRWKTARSPASTISTAPAWAMAGAS